MEQFSCQTPPVVFLQELRRRTRDEGVKSLYDF
jgi:hypothetical protein